MNHKTIGALFIVLISISQVSLAQSWNLQYGKGKGKVSVFNANTSKDFREDAPFGPMSFRVVNNNLWILDSVAGRLFSCNEKGNVILEIKISGLPENVLLEDFALTMDPLGKLESVWVAEAAESNIRKLMIGSGKEIAKFGGNGNEAGKFLQISQLEVDKNGRLYVGDIGRSKISIFTPNGKYIRELPWQMTNFAIDTEDNLHLLDYEDNIGYIHRAYSAEGKLLKNTYIGLVDKMNANILGINSQGSLIASFIPKDGYKGHLELIELAIDGKVVRQRLIKPAARMNRFMVVSDKKYWLAVADFASAPAGSFAIEFNKWDVEK